MNYPLCIDARRNKSSECFHVLGRFPSDCRAAPLKHFLLPSRCLPRHRHRLRATGRVRQMLLDPLQARGVLLRAARRRSWQITLLFKRDPCLNPALPLAASPPEALGAVMSSNVEPWSHALFICVCVCVCVLHFNLIILTYSLAVQHGLE